MKAFAESSLTYRMGRTVVDKTGISGEFDFELKFREDQDADSSDPDFLTALRERLRLVLRSEKGLVEVIVVDDAKKASAN